MLVKACCHMLGTTTKRFIHLLQISISSLQQKRVFNMACDFFSRAHDLWTLNSQLEHAGNTCIGSIIRPNALGLMALGVAAGSCVHLLLLTRWWLKGVTLTVIACFVKTFRSYTQMHFAKTWGIMPLGRCVSLWLWQTRDESHHKGGSGGLECLAARCRSVCRWRPAMNPRGSLHMPCTSENTCPFMASLTYAVFVTSLAPNYTNKV
jgi:hypothetical protein